MPLDHAWIAAHIPHQGSMCLLERVDAWDAEHIRCAAISHRDPANPLRAHGRLGAACGIEYAAQAMAVHGALLGAGERGERGEARHGYLASVRGVTLNVARLDDLGADLLVEAERLGGDGNTILYAFSVRAADTTLLAGRAAVVLDAAALTRNAGTSV
jgi:predicted hotdog family 3-hydroxylacyl-ACP dehydratase